MGCLLDFFGKVYSNSDALSITNDGDETGFTLRIEALPSDIPQEVVAVTPTIYNENGEYLQIKGDILTGDVITVTTKTVNFQLHFSHPQIGIAVHQSYTQLFHTTNCLDSKGICAFLQGQPSRARNQPVQDVLRCISLPVPRMYPSFSEE